jgi:flagellar biosynthesis/type III secretory pathway protein FliH
MNAFRLQTFTPALSSTGARSSPRDRLLERIREEAYRSGFVAGQAAATEAHIEEQSRLTSELIEAIGDARLTNEAARRHVSASLAPLVQALAGAIAPALADAGLGGEIGRLVSEALAAAPEARPRVRCAPELAQRLAGIFAERGVEVIIDPAPELLPREAQIHWDQGYDHMDLDACIERISACLASHLEPHTGSDDDEQRRYG